MASFGLYYPHLSQGQGPVAQYPYHAIPAIPVHPCLQCVHSAHENTILANRIILLETQFAQATADKKAADDATLHLLRLQSVQPLFHAQDAANRSEIAALDRNLFRLTIENHRLKDELWKVIEERELGISRARATPVTDSSQSVHHVCDSKPSKGSGGPKPEDLLDLTDDENKEYDESVEVDGQLSAGRIHGKSPNAVTTNRSSLPFSTPSISLAASYLYHFEDQKTADLLLTTRALSSNDQTSGALGDTKVPNVNSSPQLHSTASEPRPNALAISRIGEIDNGCPSNSDEAAHSAMHGSLPNNVGKAAPLRHTKDIFDCIDERKQLGCRNRAEAGRNDNKLPSIFEHGLCFTPGLDTTNVVRGLTIGNLPPKLAVAELIDAIRGGPIIDIQLVDTIAITGTRTALVTFQTEYSALAFEEFADCYGIMFHGRPAHVSVITTPTYPMPAEAGVAIFAKNHTRCLEIRNFPRHIKPSELRQDLRVSPILTIDAIESLQMGKSGVLEVRFTSVWYAGKAYTVLISREKYRGCRVVFSRDPCDRPLKTPLKEKDGIDRSAKHDVIEITQGSVEDALHDVSEDNTLAEDTSGDSSETEDVVESRGLRSRKSSERRKGSKRRSRTFTIPF